MILLFFKGPFFRKCDFFFFLKFDTYVEFFEKIGIPIIFVIRPYDVNRMILKTCKGTILKYTVKGIDRIVNFLFLK